MAQTQPPNIDPVPTPPIQRGDRATFSIRVDAFIVWLAAAVGQFMAVATNVYNNAVDAFTSATNAARSATTAAAQANAAQAIVDAQPFVPTKNYAALDSAVSLLNGQTHRRLTAGTSSTDPANDQTNWRVLPGNDMNGNFVPVPIPAANIDFSLGNYRTKEISANTTFTFSNVPSGGSSIMLRLKMTATVIVAFPSSIRTPNNAATTFTAGMTYLAMLISDDGGMTHRMVIAPNFSA